MFESTYRALAYSFRVTSDIDGVGEFVARLLAPFRVEVSGSAESSYTLTRTFDPRERKKGNVYELLKDEVSIQRVASPGSMVDWLIADFSKEAVQESEDVLAVHAAVAVRRGRAALFPAPPDSGKTTLVAGLVRDGFEFLSDEVALIEPCDLRVHPFPRPLGLSPASMEALAGLEASLPDSREWLRNVNHQLPPEDLRPSCLATAATISYVVAPRFLPGNPTRLEPMHRAEALALLVGQCFNLRSHGGTAVQVLGKVVRSAGCYRLTMGDLPSAVVAVRGLFEHR